MTYKRGIVPEDELVLIYRWKRRFTYHPDLRMTKVLSLVITKGLHCNNVIKNEPNGPVNYCLCDVPGGRKYCLFCGQIKVFLCMNNIHTQTEK